MSNLIMIFYLMTLFMILISQNWLDLYYSFVMNLIFLIYNFFDFLKKYSFELWMKYFFIQSFSALMLIFSLFFNLFLIFLIFLLVKLILPPFHLWLINSMKFISNKIIFFLLIIQKLPFFYLMKMMKINLIMIFLVLLVNLIYSISGVFWSNLIFKQLFFSSINQSFWVLISLKMKNFFFFQFYLFYLMTSLLIFFFYNNNYYLYQMNFSLFFLLINLIYMSMPPFPLFWFKWNMIFFLMKISFFFLFFSFFSIIFFNYIYFKWFFLNFIQQINLFKLSKMKSLLISVFLIFLFTY